MTGDESIRSETSKKNLRRSFGYLLNDFKSQLDNLLDKWLPVTSPKTKGKTVGYPLTDLIDDDSYYIVEAELPGAQSKDIKVEVTAESVSIKGKIDIAKKNEDSEKYLLKERRSHEFNREIIFPKCVNPKEAIAKLDEGILRVKIPKKEPETLKVITIEVN